MPEPFTPNRGNDVADKVFKPVLGNPDDFYVRSHTYLGRQFALIALVFGLTIITTSLIYSNVMMQGHWRTIAVPIILLGATALLFPQTEDWVYRPWQAAAQQVERHFYDTKV